MAPNTQLKSAINILPKKWRLPVSIIVFVIIAGTSYIASQSVSSPASTPTSTPTPTPIASTLPGFYPVIKVVDGDTITVSINGQNQTIRLVGVDTPEVVDPRQPVQCFGQQASDFSHTQLDNGQVRLEIDPSQGDKDKYNRLLRYVYLPDNTLFNLTLIQQGYAHEYTYNIPYQLQAEFKQAQQQAQDANRGLWSPNTCSGKP